MSGYMTKLILSRVQYTVARNCYYTLTPYAHVSQSTHEYVTMASTRLQATTKSRQPLCLLFTISLFSSTCRISNDFYSITIRRIFLFEWNAYESSMIIMYGSVILFSTWATFRLFENHTYGGTILSLLRYMVAYVLASVSAFCSRFVHFSSFVGGFFCYYCSLYLLLFSSQFASLRCAHSMRNRIE